MKINKNKLDELLQNSRPEDQTEYQLTPDQHRKFDEVMSKDYPIELRHEVDGEDSYWIAEHKDLPGCKTHGKTTEEAIDNLIDAKKAWIYPEILKGKEIPQPDSHENSIQKYSGKILLRVPKQLHRDIAIKAKLDGVSVNQELNYLLSKAIGSEANHMREKAKFDLSSTYTDFVKAVYQNFKKNRYSENNNRNEIRDAKNRLFEYTRDFSDEQINDYHFKFDDEIINNTLKQEIPHIIR